MGEQDIYSELGRLAGLVEGLTMRIEELHGDVRQLPCRSGQSCARPKRTSELVKAAAAATEATMDVIKSSRFWLSLAIIAAAVVLAVTKLIDGNVAIATMTGLLGGFGVAKAGASSGVKVLVPFILLGVFLSACVTTASGERRFDAAKALDTACDVAPALNLIATKVVCENLPSPKREKCLKIAAAIGITTAVGLPVAGAVVDACKVPEK